MRSKPTARKLPNDDRGLHKADRQKTWGVCRQVVDAAPIPGAKSRALRSEATAASSPHSPRCLPSALHAGPRSQHTGPSSSHQKELSSQHQSPSSQPDADSEPQGVVMKAEHPAPHAAEGVLIPDDFELRKSHVHPGFGLWSRIHLPCGQNLGPFKGVLRETVGDASCAWELVDRCGKVRGWLDASEPGTGNWMKYIRSTEQLLQRNMMAVQVDEQVFYKTVRDIRPGEEMLLYARDVLYPEMELESMHKIDEDNQAFPCADCGEVFRSKVALRRHQTYACPKSQSYSRSMTLDTSQDRVDSDGKSLDSENSGMEQEGGGEGEYKCDQCPKSFQWKSNLVRHQVTHDEDRRYPCENCDKVFTDPSNLQRHIRSQHVGARCHACSECGKTFATSSGLKQHQHIHSSVKPFQCEVCLKAYTQFSNLCRHKRMHADCRQQIKCKDCGQAFSTVTSLSKHKRFCEGALRSGMRLCYPQDKLNPMALSPGTQPAPHFNPASYMNLYGPRPPYFFPPLASAFPVLQPALPPGMLGSSPLSPSSLSLGHAGFVLDKLSAGEAIRGSPSSDQEAMRGERRRQLSDGYQTDGSLGSEPDIGSVSDEEKDAGISPCKMPKLGAEPGEISSSPFSAKHALESAASRLSFTASALLAPPGTSPPKPAAAESSGVSDMPFDLSKSSRKHEPHPPSPKEEPLTPSPKRSSPPSSSSSTKEDAPLDLSKKAAVPEVVPMETPRKTHIYGGGDLRSPVIPEPKYPFPASVPYPFPTPATLMESMLRLEKDKLSQSFQQEMAKFMAFPRYPLTGMPSPFGAINPLSMLRPEMDKGLPSPILKLDKVPEAGSHHHSPHHHPFPYGPQSVAAAAGVGGSGNGSGGMSNKLKERYACKFCGKIFPRSANLTRHLRTHTGEQPYKCKYCERSFSISSNLQRHVRNIHNKEKPFRCPLCDRSFGQQTNLDRHLKKHEQEGPHVADSPTAELENKDEAYFSEIRNFLKPSEQAGGLKPEGDGSGSPAKKELSDAEDEKDSDLTVVDEDGVDDEEAFSDDPDVDCGSEELSLAKAAWRDVKPATSALNNNAGDLGKAAAFVLNGVKDEPQSPSPDMAGFEVKAGPAAAAVACST